VSLIASLLQSAEDAASDARDSASDVAQEIEDVRAVAVAQILVRRTQFDVAAHIAVGIVASNVEPDSLRVLGER